MKDGFHAKVSLASSNKDTLSKIVLEWVKVINGVIVDTVHREEFPITREHQESSYISQGHTERLEISSASMVIDSKGKRHFTIEANTGLLGVFGKVNTFDQEKG